MRASHPERAGMRVLRILNGVNIKKPGVESPGSKLFMLTEMWPLNRQGLLEGSWRS